MYGSHSISNQAEMKTPAPLTKSLITEGFNTNQEILLTLPAFKMHNFSSLSAKEETSFWSNCTFYITKIRNIYIYYSFKEQSTNT
jgi:hypothetical protein